MPRSASPNLHPLALARDLFAKVREEMDPGPQMPLAEFARAAWPQVDPGDLQWGWAYEVICAHLEAVMRGDVRRLVVNIPPRFLKSVLTAVLLPAWWWTRRPGHSWLFGSHDLRLAQRDSKKCRDLVLSDWFRERWGGRVDLAPDQREKVEFDTTAGGKRLITSARGGGTGHGGDTVVIDDPQSFRMAMSKAEREASNEWVSGTMLTRLNSRQVGQVIVVQQRLHTEDCTAHLLAKGGWEHLCLPGEYDPAESRTVVAAGAPDLRTELGESLHPERFGPEDIEQLRRDLGRHFEGQFNQRPENSDDALWEQETIDRYRVSRPPKLVRIVVGVDPAVSAKRSSDETGIVAVGRGEDGHAYVLRDVGGRWKPLQWARQVLAVVEDVDAHYVVAEINQGGDLVESNVATVDPTVRVKQVRASRGKTLRADPVASLYSNGMVHHVGRHHRLELQLTTWAPGDDSPDRLDALVWACTELMLGKRGPSRERVAAAREAARQAPGYGVMEAPKW